MRSIITLIFLLCFYTNSFAIFVKVSYSPWEGWDMTRRVVRNTYDRVREHSMIANTISMYNLFNDTKHLTSDISATIKDIDAFQKLIRKDAKTLSLISQGQMNSINEFLSWKRTLKGQDGESMLRLNDFYETVTNEFRDANGNLSVSQTIYSHLLSDEERLNKTRSWSSFQFKMRQVDKIYKDGLLLEKIRLSKELDQKAYFQMLVLNAEVFRGRVGNIGNQVQSLTHSTDYLKNKGVSKSKGTLSEKEIIELQASVLELQNQSANYRNEAFTLLDDIIALESEDWALYENARYRYRASLLAAGKGASNSKTQREIEDGYRSIRSKQEINRILQ